MVGGPAVADAVARARRLPALRVGLHLALVEARPVLPLERVPDLVDAQGYFRGDMLRAAGAIFLSRKRRRQLAAEIDAQFAHYQATGLPLDHVNAHRHFHLHPTIAGQILDIGRHYGMRSLRVPAEPKRLLTLIEPDGKFARDWVTAPWVRLLKARVRRRGLAAPDQVFGLAWSGAMTKPRMEGLLAQLPEGLTEIYTHPATAGGFAGAAPGYRYADELAALTDPHAIAAVRASGARLGGFADLATTT
jgi:hopanoid biosynthesis associated protein HpnK